VGGVEYQPAQAASHCVLWDAGAGEARATKDSIRK